MEQETEEESYINCFIITELKSNKELEKKFIYPTSRIQKEDNIQVCISAMDITREMYHKVLEHGVPACNVYTFYDAVIYCISHYFTENKLDNAVGKKNIILDCFNGLGLGGVESWTIDICKALLSRGRSSTYIISDGGTYDIEEELIGHIIDVEIDHDMKLKMQ